MDHRATTRRAVLLVASLILVLAAACDMPATDAKITFDFRDQTMVIDRSRFYCRSCADSTDSAGMYETVREICMSLVMMGDYVDSALFGEGTPCTMRLKYNALVRRGDGLHYIEKYDYRCVYPDSLKTKPTRPDTIRDVVATVFSDVRVVNGEIMLIDSANGKREVSADARYQFYTPVNKMLVWDLDVPRIEVWQKDRSEKRIPLAAERFFTDEGEFRKGSIPGDVLE